MGRFVIGNLGQYQAPQFTFVVTIDPTLSHLFQPPYSTPLQHNMEADKIPIPTFLAQQRDEVAPPELQPLFLDFEEFWERKLWHQLTEALLQFYNHTASGPQRIPIYKNFVLSFAAKINQLKLVSLGLAAASQCKGRLPPQSAIFGTFKLTGHSLDYGEALEFMTGVAAKVNQPASQDAYVYATVETARIKLYLGDLEGARTALDEAERILDRFDSVEPMVNASFYRVNADYYHVKIPSYYTTLWVTQEPSSNH